MEPKGKKNLYFDFQLETGFTKHPGGLSSIKKLIDLCKITKESYVLDVGCGTGKTALYLAEKIGCRVIAVDISKNMLKHAKEKTKGLTIEFFLADVHNLQFKDNQFDVVIGESITAFVDKPKAISEYIRVLKPEGYLGLSETTWIKPPPKEFMKYSYNTTGGIMPESEKKWRKLLEGLDDFKAKTYRINVLKQLINEIRIVNIFNIIKSFYRLLSIYIKHLKYRPIIKNMFLITKKIPKGFFEYYGYGIYVGKKQKK